MLSENITKVRELRGMTIDDLAEETGIPGYKLIGFETDTEEPKLEDLHKIAQALKCAVGLLLEEEMDIEDALRNFDEFASEFFDFIKDLKEEDDSDDDDEERSFKIVNHLHMDSFLKKNKGKDSCYVHLEFNSDERECDLNDVIVSGTESALLAAVSVVVEIIAKESGQDYYDIMSEIAKTRTLTKLHDEKRDD